MSFLKKAKYNRCSLKMFQRQFKTTSVDFQLKKLSKRSYRRKMRNLVSKAHIKVVLQAKIQILMILMKVFRYVTLIHLFSIFKARPKKQVVPNSDNTEHSHLINSLVTNEIWRINWLRTEAEQNLSRKKDRTLKAKILKIISQQISCIISFHLKPSPANTSMKSHIHNYLSSQ